MAWLPKHILVDTCARAGGRAGDRAQTAASHSQEAKEARLLFCFLFLLHSFLDTSITLYTNKVLFDRDPNA